ncbi:MAG TPA: carboxypeptidase-like regulatory domain-containing protein [Candidatus Thermoplasmatota archaeon]|nr:carboxypeptidase-like regulatory domain-containing protein [Candidatus Thermoplasmatota archaeon]
MRMMALVAAMLVAALAGCSSETPTGEPGGSTPANGRLRGIAVDDAIRPIEGVRVELDGAANTTTDAEGAFLFEGVVPGAHVVRATKAGFADTVAQAVLGANEEPPLLKLVLVPDLSTLAYAETQAIEGYVECGMYGASFRYAACGTGNVASLIACSTFNVCLGNLTQDRYIVAQSFARQPDFLVAEVVWTPTQALGEQLQVYIGAATPEDLAAASTNDYNGTIGPSPLYVTMNKTMLVDSKLGHEAMFLSQTFAAPSVKPCEFGACGVGLVVQQRFTYYLTSFFGFEPAKEWRFVADGPALPPA